jgi:predicted NBD/HSP70 family sugar kinase
METWTDSDILSPSAHDATGHDKLKPRGSNQIGMRQFNERVVLQAIRLRGNGSKADLARVTRLSTQTVSLIIDRLLRDELVIKLDPMRGKVGQPSVPIALNPNGAFSIGIKIGRRSCDILLVDFVGQVRERSQLNYDFPDPDTLFAYIREQLEHLRQRLGPLGARLHGVGIAAPLSLDGWQKLLGVAPERASRWRDVDIAQTVQQMTELPVELAKDTSAACVAELVAGRGRNIKSYLYVFFDTFVGGGLVIDSHLHSGLRGNAGAVGSMPMHQAQAGGSAPTQFLGLASLFNLEQSYMDAGLEPSASTDERALQAPWADCTETWLRQAANALAMVAHNANCLLDFDGVIVDGIMHRKLLSRLLDATRLSMQDYNWEGGHQPVLFEGVIGADARAIGGALLPLYSNFAPDRDLFLKLDE